MTIEEIKHVLQNGQLAAIPTETVYGLAANALDVDAVAKIFQLKERPYFNPLIVHIKNQSEISKYCKDVPPVAFQLAEKYWPGPLTLILKSNGTIGGIVTGGQKTVGIRIPNHPQTLALLQKIDFPLAAPSANPFQKTSPTLPDHVKSYFGDNFPILDGGACQVGIESTILAVEENGLEILRHGSITSEQISLDFPNVKLIKNQTDAVAPGSSRSHYAPKTPLYLGKDIHKLQMELKPHHRVAYLNFMEEAIDLPEQFIQFYFNNHGDLNQIASILYQTLFKIDQNNFDAIYCPNLPEEGIGKALNDKLRRASTK